ncbi:MAG: polysaccharide biosynthesis protein [Clostridiales bacterium]|jgi:FlaA1/EpsC-like NDP-sugar epimerase|nr:polysaccharide biosynthesis protein [Clostridiales bacterium]
MKLFKFFSRERLGKIFLYMAADVIVVLFSVLFSMIVWRQGFVPGSNIIGVFESDWMWFAHIAAFASVLTLAANTVFRLYDNLWKYASIDEIIKIFVSSTCVFILLFFYDVLFIEPLELNDVSRRMYFIAWVLNSFLVTFSRFGYRFVKRLAILISHAISSKAGLKRVMVVGASYSGYGVIRGIKQERVRDRIPVLVVDADTAKNNTSIMGVRVVGGLEQIPQLAEKYEIDEIVIAMPTAEPEELRNAVDICTGTNCLLKIMPPISDVTADAKAGYSYLRDVNISDLLYREEVKLDTKNINDYLRNKVVIVTGGGGSIGSELCRQIAKFSPSKLIIFDIYENNAFELLNELGDKYNKNELNIFFRLGSVRDKARLREVFTEFKPHVVFHAAAHKHVSIIEENQAEAVKNNCVGTQNLAKISDEFGAERFVLISSDKAVNPANAYGATKRIAELLVQGMAAKSKTKFMVVRFGNVLGSNGSVLHLFKQQIAAGGPVKITGSPDMVRYFMTIPEAAQLVLQATSLGQSGKILVLDMGTPIKILDLAKKVIQLSGYKPDTDIKIIYTDPRPGDKEYEELIMEEEKTNMQVTLHKKVFITKPIEMDYEKFERQLAKLCNLAEKKPSEVNGMLREMVPNYV